MSVNTVSQDKHNKAVNFKKRLETIMEVMDEVIQLIPEGAYLRVADTLKELFDDRDVVPQADRVVFIHRIRRNMRRDPVVHQEYQRASRPARKVRAVLTDKQKLDSGEWKMCCVCDRIVCTGYLEEHQQTDVCIRIQQSKKLCATTGEVENDKMAQAIINLRCAIMGAGRYRQHVWGVMFTE